MIKIYYVPCYGGGTREYKLIKQGLVNNPRVELVDDDKDSDFVFYFYFTRKHRKYYTQEFPPEKTVLIDYSDKVYWLFQIPCFVYFKRSWVLATVIDTPGGIYTTKAPIPRAPHLHPLILAIMDEFIIKKEIKRDIVLSCPLRINPGNPNRQRVLDLVGKMDIQGKTQIGVLNSGSIRAFNDSNMKDYFRLLKRSQIIVTCNPSKWEGDHRTWEAFANGALVFVDKMYTSTTHPLVDGKHCIFYDLSDKGLKELQEKIFYFLKHTKEAKAIAKVGHDFTMKYHRASNRIDEILAVILK